MTLLHKAARTVREAIKLALLVAAMGLVWLALVTLYVAIGG